MFDQKMNVYRCDLYSWFSDFPHILKKIKTIFSVMSQFDPKVNEGAATFILCIIDFALDQIKDY